MKTLILSENENQLKRIISEIMDIEISKITFETYIIRDLEAESIDLLEISVELSNYFEKSIEDDKIFLTQLRSLLTEKSIEEQPLILKENYPHLSETRINEIIKDLKNGPVLQLKDLFAYINFI